jgi:hypothetical protein
MGQQVFGPVGEVEIEHGFGFVFDYGLRRA